jgi:NADH dehydrogenase FAD-containing subunit
VTDAETGDPCPPTAQFALHEAYTLAHNIHASVRGQPPSLSTTTGWERCASWATTPRAPRSRAYASPGCWPG